MTDANSASDFCGLRRSAFLFDRAFPLEIRIRLDCGFHMHSNRTNPNKKA